MAAMAAMGAGDLEEAQEQVQLARICNPNSPTAIAVESHLLIHTGQPAQARQGQREFLRLDPRGPLSAWVMHLVAVAYYFERDYAKSVEAARHTLARYPNYPVYRWLAAGLGQLEKTEEAGAALRKALELSPRSFEFYTRRRPPWHSPENYEHMLEGLRKAGWDG
jgi:adenylate cyclase